MVGLSIIGYKDEIVKDPSTYEYVRSKDTVEDPSKTYYIYDERSNTYNEKEYGVIGYTYGYDENNNIIVENPIISDETGSPVAHGWYEYKEIEHFHTIKVPIYATPTSGETSPIPQLYAEEFGNGSELGFEEIYEGDFGSALFEAPLQKELDGEGLFKVDPTNGSDFSIDDLYIGNGKKGNQITYLAYRGLKHCYILIPEMTAEGGLIDWYILAVDEKSVKKHLIVKSKERPVNLIENPDIYGLDFLFQDTSFRSHVVTDSSNYITASGYIITDVKALTLSRLQPFQLVINDSSFRLPAEDF